MDHEAVWNELRIEAASDALQPGERTIRQLADAWNRPYVSVECYMHRLQREGRVTFRWVQLKVGHCVRRVKAYMPVAGVAIGQGPAPQKADRDRNRDTVSRSRRKGGGRR